MPVLIVILIISFLVIIHELGHFLAARKAKINIQEFGIGYPPKLLKLFTWKGTDFTLNAIPFGGFVRLEGENGPDLEKLKDGNPKLKPNEWAPFYAKTAKQRIKVILAGVLVNICFAVLAFSIVFSFIGIPKDISDQARIGTVMENSPAAEARLPENVNIVEIQTDQRSYKIKNLFDVQQAVEENQGQMLTIVTTLECDQLKCPKETQQFEVYARTKEETPEGQGSIGIIFQDMIFVFYPWYEMPFRGSWIGIQQAISLGYLIVKALIDMFGRLISTGQVPQDVAGPVGIVYQAQQGNLISQDFWNNLGFAGMLSLNLGIMNLLPIPALDGGRALFIFLEKIFGRKKIIKIEAYANYAGFTLLILLIILITAKDVGTIISQ